MALDKLVDMRLSAEDKTQEAMPFDHREYPYGLCLSLTEKELEKLDVPADEFKIGDVVDLRALAKVTSVSEHESEHGKCCRVELQVIMLGAEDEDAEPAPEPKRKRR